MKNLAIRASAGTGKTYELAVQFIARLASGADPGATLAATFTRKAAGEIMGRIVARVAEASTDRTLLDVLNDDLRRTQKALGITQKAFTDAECFDLLRVLCRDVHRLRISTLDSLFVRLLAALSAETDVPSLPGMTDEASAEASRARAAAIQSGLRKMSPTEALELLDRLAGGEARRDVARTLDQLLSELHYAYRTSPPDAWDRLPAVTLPGDSVRMSLAQELRDSAASRGSQLASALIRMAEQIEAGRWEQLSASGPLKSFLEGKSTFGRTELDHEILILLERIRDAMRDVLIARAREQTLALYRLLDAFAQEYSRRLRDEDLLLFGELPLLLLQVLEDLPPEVVAYRCGLRTDHVLLDEFQDTNPEQWLILRKLFGLDAMGSGRSFFCVGDSKQAIYGWRGGCAALFDQLKSDIPSLEEDHRQICYRSSQTILDFVDLLFGNLGRWPGCSGFESVLAQWERSYKPHTAASDRPGYVEVVIAPSGTDADVDEESEPSEEEDAAPEYLDWLADQIRALAERYPASNIGVLTRTNAMAERITTALHLRDVAVSHEGPGVLTDDPAVEIILSAIYLADHPEATAEAFHVFHSPIAPWLEFTDDSPETRARVAARLRQRLASSGYGALVRRLGEELAPFGDQRTALRLTQLAEMAAGYDRRPRVRPADFVEAVRAHTISETMPARIRVMSIHQSKGLEFDIVCLPEMHRSMGLSRPPAVLVRRAHEAGPVQGVYAYPGKRTVSLCDQLSAAYEQHRSRVFREELNLLYVAVTRAKSALYIFLPPRRVKRDGTFAKEQTPGDLILHALGRSDVRTGCAYSTGTKEWAVTKGDPGGSAVSLQIAVPGPIAFNASRPRRLWPYRAPSEAEGEPAAWSRTSFAPTARAQERGLLLHAWLQQIGWLDEGIPGRDILFGAARSLNHRLSTQDLEDCYEALQRVLEQPNTQAVLNRPTGAVELWREHPFIVRTKDALLQGRMDRVELHFAGDVLRRVVVTDFKTDRVNPDETLARARSYASQMRAYAQALSLMLRFPYDRVETRLVFVLPDVVVTDPHLLSDPGQDEPTGGGPSI